MTYEPTRTEARLFVVCLCVFWLLGGLGERSAALGAALVLPALPLGFAVFLVLARVVSRETGVPVHRVLGWRSPFRRDPDATAAGMTMTFLGLRRVWWRAVVRASGWPGPAVAVAVVGSGVIALAIGVLGHG